MRGARTLGSLAGSMIILMLCPAVPGWAGSAATRQANPAAPALPAPVPCNTTAGSCWQPPLVATWQYQLQGSLNSAGQ